MSNAVHTATVRNAGIIAISRLVSVLVAFVCVPVIVGKLGLLGYGVWESVLASVTLWGLLQNAVNTSLLWKLSQYLGRNDPGSALVYLRAGMGANLLFALVIAGGMYGVREWLVEKLNVPADLRWVSTYLPILVLAVGFRGIGDACGAYLAASHRSGQYTALQVLGLIGANLSTIVMILCGVGFVSLVLGYVLGACAVMIAAVISVGRITGGGVLVPRLPDRAQIRETMRYCALSLLGSLTMLLRDQADKLVIAALGNPAVVGLYAIAVRFASVISMISDFFYIPTVAAAGSLFAKQDWWSIRSLYERNTFMVATLAGAVAVVLCGCYDRLLMWWMGHPMPEAALYVWVVALGTLFGVVVTGPGTAICKGIGRIEIESLYVAANFACSLILKVILVYFYSAIGAVLSSFIGWMLGSLIFVVYLHRKLELPSAATRRIFGTVLMVIGLAVALRFLDAALDRAGYVENSVPGFVALAGGGIAAFGLMQWWLWRGVAGAQACVRQALQSVGMKGSGVGV